MMGGCSLDERKVMKLCYNCCTTHIDVLKDIRIRMCPLKQTKCVHFNTIHVKRRESELPCKTFKEVQ